MMTHNLITPSKLDDEYDYYAKEDENVVNGDEALLDLAQLEELHQEAEKMKALGNKHMASQVSKASCV
jgi:hypothetical protein